MDPIRFNQRMFGLSRNVVSNANDIVKGAARSFMKRVIDETPVDTGKAVSNWKVGLGYEPHGIEQSAVPGKGGSTAAPNRERAYLLASTRISARVTGQTIYVVNNAEYIDRLNNGYSDQAPGGFIDQAVADTNAYLRSQRLLGRI